MNEKESSLHIHRLEQFYWNKYIIIKKYLQKCLDLFLFDNKKTLSYLIKWTCRM